MSSFSFLGAKMLSKIKKLILKFNYPWKWIVNDILNKIKITKIIQGKLDKVYFAILDALVSMFTTIMQFGFIKL